MNEGNNEKPKKNFGLIQILLLLFIFYIFFLLYQAVYFNYATSRKIRDLKGDLVKLEQDKERLQSLIVYYQTDSFRELEARKKLGMKMPGEKIIKVEVEEETASPAVEAEEFSEDESEKPNWQKWIDFVKGENF